LTIREPATALVSASLDPLELVALPPLMKRSLGSPLISLALLDGPVASTQPGLLEADIRGVPDASSASCAKSTSSACRHGTFVAGILSAARGGLAPAIAPACPLLVRPIFRDDRRPWDLPSASPLEVAQGIFECVEAGARVINLSAAFAEPTTRAERELHESLDHAARRGTVVVAAAGNQGTLGSSAITRHPWVIPVAAYSLSGHPLPGTNLGSSIGRHGVGAPGEGVIGVASAGNGLPVVGTSVAAPFVTGAIGLLWSEFPEATAVAVRRAVLEAVTPRRLSVAPPLLNAWESYMFLHREHEGGERFEQRQ